MRKAPSLTLSLQSVGRIQFAESSVLRSYAGATDMLCFAVSAVMPATNEWQAHPESGVAASRFGGDRSVVSFDDRVDNREAQPISGAAVRGVLRADESIEKMGE